MNIFTTFEHYNKNCRGHLIDLLKPFTKETAKRLTYGDFVRNVNIVRAPIDSDVCVLPMSWNYYAEGRRHLANQFIQQCLDAGKQVLSFTSGDFGVTPWKTDVIVLRASGYESKRLTGQYAQPVFIRDPVHEFYRGNFSPREYTRKPSIGFCGHCKCSPAKAAKEISQTLLRNLNRWVGSSHDDVQTLYPATRRRALALKYIEISEDVCANFIKRDQYRAGAADKASRRRTTVEFFNNIKNTDYTLCLRGGGNFSVRLYEALAMGRIPVFVNTDCILPFDQWIPWEEHVVWIEEDEIPVIGEKVAEFHSRLTVASFNELQRKNRQLWTEWLSFSGFHEKLLKYIVNTGVHV